MSLEPASHSKCNTALLKWRRLSEVVCYVERGNITWTGTTPDSGVLENIKQRPDSINITVTYC